MGYASRYLWLDREIINGPDVMELQEKLKKLHFYYGKANGYFNVETAKAVIAFQQTNRLEADGIVGPDTWSSLNLQTAETFFVSIESVDGQADIIVDIDKRILLFSSAEFVKTYPVAVGKKTTPTPLGNWAIVQKALNPGGPFGVRWMRLNVPWGSYGIHGTNNPSSIGKAVSHGCIRMYNEDVVEVYDRSPIGTPVTIIGKAYAYRNLKKGDKGSDVQEVQKMLKKLGYYNAKLDGDFGITTEKAVKLFQADQGLTVDGIVGIQTLQALQKAYAVVSGIKLP